LLDEHIEHVSNRIKELRALEKDLRRLRSLCERRPLKIAGFFSLFLAPQGARSDRRMLSTETAACTRCINDCSAVRCAHSRS
jgi:hypothetical protein